MTKQAMCPQPCVHHEYRRATDRLRLNGWEKEERPSNENGSKNRRRSPSTSVLLDTKQPDFETDLQWLPFRDEDYIVFCFKNDGAFNVVKEKKSEASNSHECCTIVSPRPINRKLIYGEHPVVVDQNSQEPVLSEDGAGFDSTDERESDVSNEKDVESIYFDVYSTPGTREEQCEDGNEEHGTNSLESSISTHSGSSTSSFAFPVLQWEWNGSPVKMPKSEEMQFRKHRAWRLGLYCCRF